ncbi:TraR/DksA family transcriptional regulator [Vibrio breoganii]
MNNSDHYLTKDQILAYKQKIIDKVNNDNNLASTSFKDATVKEQTSDISDIGTQTETANLNLALGHHSLTNIREMEKALRNFDPDEFGYCETCGVEIGVKRLDIFPWKENCADCQEIIEFKNNNKKH